MALSPDQIYTLPLGEQEKYLNGPALKPPENIVPNFHNPDNGNAYSHFFLAVFVALSTSFGSIHAFSQIARMKKVHLEDYFALFAYVCYIGYIAVTYWLVIHQGNFVHQWDMSVNDFIDRLLIVHIGSQLYCFVMGIMKTIILLAWIRIFTPRGVRNVFVWTCWIFIAINGLFYLIGFIMLHLSATPYKRIYDFTTPGTTHFNSSTTIVAGAAINVALDVIILVIPQKIIWGLKLKKSKKIGVSLIFMIGITGCVSAVCRLGYSVRFYLSDDVSYSIPAMSMCCIAEMTCTIIIYCAPSLPKAIKRAENKVQDSSQRSVKNPSAFTWSDTEGGVSNSRSKYTRINEYGVPLSNVMPMERSMP